MEPSGAQRLQPLATSGKCEARKRLRQPKTVAVRCDQLPIPAQGEEGIDVPIRFGVPEGSRLLRNRYSGPRELSRPLFRILPRFARLRLSGRSSAGGRSSIRSSSLALRGADRSVSSSLASSSGCSCTGVSECDQAAPLPSVRHRHAALAESAVPVCCLGLAMAFIGRAASRSSFSGSSTRSGSMRPSRRRSGPSWSGHLRALDRPDVHARMRGRLHGVSGVGWFVVAVGILQDLLTYSSRAARTVTGRPPPSRSGQTESSSGEVLRFGTSRPPSARCLPSCDQQSRIRDDSMGQEGVSGSSPEEGSTSRSRPGRWSRR